ncbi:hypothetical protein [Krasilnikovia sp. MM14-A1259]|uniref:hypothetical protein n=1 Tax=Krasilnikovia sp. MM14-A1259 TaxID=3373539 RepID=UPI003808E0A8
MRSLRLLLPLAAAVGTVLAGPTAASAAPYVPGVAPTVVAPAAVPAGAPVSIRGTGFIPLETVQISQGSTLIGSTSATAGGDFTFTVPASITNLVAGGVLSLTATGVSSGTVTGFTVRVTPLAGGGAGNPGGQGSGEQGNGGPTGGGQGNRLPVTGIDGGRLVGEMAGGAAIAATGAFLFWIAAPGRRRRRQQP